MYMNDALQRGVYTLLILLFIRRAFVFFSAVTIKAYLV